MSPTPSGTETETILHRFTNDGDGFAPLSGLILDTKGNLLGTTSLGGAYGEGTVFKLVRLASGEWQEIRLIDFSSSSPSGSMPLAGLVLDANGNLYGTTSEGGIYGGGAVFEIAHPDLTAVPQFSVPAGTYTSMQKVTIRDYTPDAKIYYTTNGDEPSAESSDEYSGPIEVKHSETIKAIAVAKGLTDSGVASATYVIHLPPGSASYPIRP